MNKPLAPGKLPSTILQRLLTTLPRHDKSTIIPPGIGLDAAGIKIGNKLISITTDPITFSTDAIGTYSVAVNINDIACLGCLPRWFTATLLLPIGTNEKDLTKIWGNLTDELAHYNIQSIGGHIEVTPTVNIPIIVGQMLGETLGKNFLDIRRAKPQDKILLWRPIALEGTAIIAKTLSCSQTTFQTATPIDSDSFAQQQGVSAESKRSLLNINEHCEQGHNEAADQNAKSLYYKISTEFPPPKLQQLQNIIHTPGICILPLIKKIVPSKGLVGIHDPTEGGLATALHEIADVCNCGLAIDYSSIPIMPETQKLAELLQFDPLGLLASGSALIICRPNAADAIIDKVADNQLSIIGTLTSSKQRYLFKDNKKITLPRYAKDELINATRKAVV